MEFILNELQLIDVGGSIEPELLDTIDLIATTMNGLKGDGNNGK